MFDVEGFILVGGLSSRMGTDKSRLLFCTQTAVERMATELRSITSRVFLVGSSYEHPDPGLKVIPDVHKNWGALGGIHSALSACQGEWATIVACDLPFVTRDLFWRLLLLTRQAQPESSDAIVPIQP